MYCTVGEGLGQDMLYVNFFPATFLRFFRTQIVLLQSVRNTIDEEERADGRNDSKGNFV